MSWSIDYRAEVGVLWVTTAGVHTPEDVRRMALEGFAEAKRLGALRILVDDRNMLPDFRALDVYKLPRQFEGWGAVKGTRVATVYSGASPMKDEYRFYELVAANFGGVEVRVFADSVEKALEWLSGGPADKA